MRNILIDFGKKYTILLIVLFLFGCGQKEVKLPTIESEGLQEIHNHSQVWFFYEVKDKDTIAKINKNNTISTTHWIFNIDKKLPIKTIIPSVIKLREKHSNGVHSKEGMHNYFSYASTISNKLTFFEFDNVIFKMDSLLSKSFIKKNSENYINYNNINLTFNPENIRLNDTKIDANELKNTLVEFIDFTSEGKQTMLHLNFNKNLKYQDYLKYSVEIRSMKSPEILVNDIEFIFDKNKVPDCGCE